VSSWRSDKCSSNYCKPIKTFMAGLTFPFLVDYENSDGYFALSLDMIVTDIAARSHCERARV
jgi:hypothetical protein